MVVEYHYLMNSSHDNDQYFTFNTFLKPYRIFWCNTSTFSSSQYILYGPDHTQSLMRSCPRGHNEEARQFTHNNWGQLTCAQLPNSADLLLVTRSWRNHWQTLLIYSKPAWSFRCCLTDYDDDDILWQSVSEQMNPFCWGIFDSFTYFSW